MIARKKHYVIYAVIGLISVLMFGCSNGSELNHFQDGNESTEVYLKKDGGTWVEVRKNPDGLSVKEAANPPSAARISMDTTSGSDIFETYVAYPTGSWPEATAIGDVNNDGKNDVVMTTSFYSDPDNDYKIFIFYQDASGELMSPVKYDTNASYTSRPETIDIGDLNNDGLNDIVIGCKGSHIEVFLQTQTGAMAPGVMYPTNCGLKVRVGDFNNDGLDDVATIGWSNMTVDIFLQDENAAFNLPVTYDVNYGGYNDMEAGDVNNDGLTDIIVMSGQGTYDNIGILHQTPEGDFDSPTYLNIDGSSKGVGVGDINGDTLNDIVLSYGGNRPNAFIAVFHQTSTGMVLDSTFEAYDIPEPVVTGDVNNDGKNDVIVAHGGWRNIGVYLQDMDGELLPYELYPVPYASHYDPHGLSIGDINGDGANDIVLADYNNGLVVLRNKNEIPPDLDYDGMDDVWELTYFGTTDRDGTGDFDNDDLTDLLEFENNTNPTLMDSEDDGMPDGWEVQMGTDPITDDAQDDPDLDGFANIDEYLNGTDPFFPDYDYGALYTFENLDGTDDLNDHDGILVNDPAFAFENNSQTLVLNGLDQYMEIPTHVLFPVTGTTTSIQYPWQDNENGTEVNDIGWNYNMGYRFTVNSDGKITKLGGHFQGTKTVRLYDYDTGFVLASADVTSNNNWQYTEITPIIAHKGDVFVVAVFLEGSGGSYRHSISTLPQTYNDITIQCSSYLYNSTAMPLITITATMYGQADIEFETQETTYLEGTHIKMAAKVKPFEVDEGETIETSPWQENINGTQHLNVGFNYNMGYQFTANTDGEIIKLGGLFSGTKQVRLYRYPDGAEIASATVTSGNDWQYTDIDPIQVTAGSKYIVAAYMEGSGASYQSGVSYFPQNYGSITIERSAYIYNATTMPLNFSTTNMYGQADIVFSTNTRRVASIIEKPNVYSLALEGDQLAIKLGDGNGWLATLKSDPLDIIAGNWYTMEGTYDGMNITLYLDDVQVGQQYDDTLILQGNNSTITIGASTDEQNFFNGHLDDVLLTNSVQ